MSRVSSIKDLDHYDRRVFTAMNAGFTLERRGSTVNLELGTEFYVRPAGSAPNTWRVVMPNMGVTRVFSIGLDEFTRLTRLSREWDEE